jgi:hypothetical protein
MEWNYISASHIYQHGGGGGVVGSGGGRRRFVYDCMEADSTDQPQLVAVIIDRSHFTQFLGCCSASIRKFTQLLNITHSFLV